MTVVEAYVDVLCPWCWIGKRRLDAALGGLSGPRPEIVWRAYELDPDAGRSPGPTAAEAMARWWGDRAEARVRRIRELGAAEGLDLDLHRARPVNTFDAHRLCRLAGERGLAGPMLERLLRAYHSQGRDVADPHTLRDLATEVGLDDAEVRVLLDGDRYADEVRADRRRAVERGVTGVPTLVVGDHAPVPGIQPVGRLRDLMAAARTG
ncbi:DsbA family oxidoreductase [Micromonospora endolithica]|uniref:DsbA family oxidoreductase n=1 Tax=Micromonospora endolithica TaxID=230091 RepID=A0A3A9ZRZ9_9ACTN|nr:DsbA family oxidoreductase [Micromonospora endolithica]RKN50903.1 DsbA family oxidoreductase [Micromonospora endolithica]TWJ20327.1 putative DsbA family dithiol-disulfide isomerase [Micromonospora endolithica]